MFSAMIVCFSDNRITSYTDDRGCHARHQPAHQGQWDQSTSWGMSQWQERRGRSHEISTWDIRSQWMWTGQYVTHHLRENLFIKSFTWKNLDIVYLSPCVLINNRWLFILNLNRFRQASQTQLSKHVVLTWRWHVMMTYWLTDPSKSLQPTECLINVL